MKQDVGDHRLESLEATVVTYDDAPDECTIYPRVAPETYRTTAWITATEGAFCEILEMR